VRVFSFDERTSFVFSLYLGKKNKSGPSFTRTLLEHTENHQLATDEMAYLAGTLFGTGADTASIGKP
jgi:hypothetical protein